MSSNASWASVGTGVRRRGRIRWIVPASDVWDEGPTMVTVSRQVWAVWESAKVMRQGAGLGAPKVWAMRTRDW